MLDYTNTNLITSKFSSLLSSNSSALIAGADQGQGAWHSWIKIATMSGEDVRNKMIREENFDIKSSDIIAQVAHISCKKIILFFPAQYQTGSQKDMKNYYPTE